MNRLARRLMPSAAALLLSPAARAAVELRRRVRREPHRLFYFHQVDDPYAQLTAQVLEWLIDRYDVVLEPRLVGPPPEEAAPERALLDASTPTATTAPGARIVSGASSRRSDVESA